LFQLLAEVTPDVSTWIGPIIQQLGIGGVLVWHLYHVTTKTLPDQQAMYLDSQKEITQLNSATHKEISNKFVEALKEDREVRRLEILEDREMRKRELEELRESLRKESPCRFNSQ
jgi:hypothetical protein